MSNDLTWVKESIEDCYNQSWQCRPDPYFLSENCLKIQLFGAELILSKEGTWFISDTSGG